MCHMMKQVFFCGVILLLGQTGFATEKDARTIASDLCEAAAKTKLESDFKHYFFTRNKRVREVETVSCELRTSKKGSQYNECEVGASTGKGAGDVTFKVMISKNCKTAFAAFIIGEE